MKALHNGAPFPNISIPAVGGGILSLPGGLADSYGVILIYRGSWCPYCNAQLAAFSRAIDKLTELNIKVVALSVDDLATSAALVQKQRITFPIGYGADADKVAAATGAFTNDDPHYLQSTGFVLDPNGNVITAVYSTGAIGRLLPDDVIGFVRYVQSHELVS